MFKKGETLLVKVEYKGDKYWKPYRVSYVSGDGSKAYLLSDDFYRSRDSCHFEVNPGDEGRIWIRPSKPAPSKVWTVAKQVLETVAVAVGAILLLAFLPQITAGLFWPIEFLRKIIRGGGL